VASNLLKNKHNITLYKNNKLIVVTKKTIRFSTNVYQTSNIASFGEGEVDIGTIPWIFVISFLIIGLNIHLYAISYAIGSTAEYTGTFLLSLGGIGTFWNWFKPQYYGLFLTLNSGDKTLFVINDKIGLKKVILDIYEFIEAEKNEVYEISIKNSQVSGNFVQGNIGGSTSFNADR